MTLKLKKLKSSLVKKDKILLALFIFVFLIINNLFAFDRYLFYKVTSEIGTNTTLAYIFDCGTNKDCKNPVGQLNFEVYDFDKVKNCFYDYNINDINSCVEGGKISNTFYVGPDSPKYIVIKVSTPDKSSRDIYMIFYNSNTLSMLFEQPLVDLTNYNVQYYNDPYYYLHGQISEADRTLEMKRINLNGEYSVSFQNFDVQNDVKVNLPLLIKFQTGISSKVCALLEKNEDYYIPDPQEYYKLPIDVQLNIYDENNNLIKTETKTINYYGVCDNSANVEFTWVPTKTGNYTIELSGKVNDNYVYNDKPAIAQDKVHVYDPNQQFCYTNIVNVSITNQYGTQYLYNNNDIFVSFNLLSGISEGDGSFSPTGSTWSIYVDGQLIKSGVLDNNALDYKKIIVNIGKLNSGEHTIEIIGKASYCPYSDNKERIITQTIEVKNGTITNPGNTTIVENATQIDNNTYIENNTQTNSNLIEHNVKFNIYPLSGYPPLNVSFGVVIEPAYNTTVTVKIDYNGDGKIDYTTSENIQTGKIYVIQSNYVYWSKGTYYPTIYLNDSEGWSYTYKTKIEVYAQNYYEVGSNNVLATTGTISFESGNNKYSSSYLSSDLLQKYGNLIKQAYEENTIRPSPNNNVIDLKFNANNEAQNNNAKIITLIITIIIAVIIGLLLVFFILRL